jgi:hypothetical protein
MSGMRPTHSLIIKAHDAWHEVGVAWPNRSGDGFNIKLNPLIVLSASQIQSLNLVPRRDRYTSPDDVPALSRGKRRKRKAPSSEVDELPSATLDPGPPLDSYPDPPEDNGYDTTDDDDDDD